MKRPKVYVIDCPGYKTYQVDVLKKEDGKVYGYGLKRYTDFWEAWAACCKCQGCDWKDPKIWTLRYTKEFITDVLQIHIDFLR